MSKPYISEDAVLFQLQTIRSIITPTINMFETTYNIDDIQTNLNAIQKCIDCLRPDPSKESEDDE